MFFYQKEHAIEWPFVCIHMIIPTRGSTNFFYIFSINSFVLLISREGDANRFIFLFKYPYDIIVEQNPLREK